MKRVLLFCAVMAAAGCTSATTFAPQSVQSQTASQHRTQRDGGAWMDGIAKKVDLLYISEGDGQVTVYTYWQKTLVGQLTGFSQPMGECVDKNNNVYITDYLAKQIVEYAHAGKTPIATIDEAPYAPHACSVDQSTGAIAVANEAGSSSQGNIAVYANPSAKPKIYTDKSITNFQACAYDGSGNLLASDDSASRGDASFAWLAKNGGKLIDVTLPGPQKSFSWNGVSGIQWDGRYYVIDDYDLFRVSVVNAQGFYVGETSLNNCCGQTTAVWIYNIHPNKQGTQVVGGFSERSYNLVEYWNYPAGGDQIGYVSKGIDNPTAVTVSLGKIHE
jgi:hypothetical protein